MKFDEKYASLKDKPSGIARQLTPITPEKGGDRKPSAKVAGRPPRVPKARREKAKQALAEAETRTDKLTKAQKVKAWRLANPELYAAQKRRTAERQAKKRAEKEQG